MTNYTIATHKNKQGIKLFNLLLVLYPVTNIYGIGIQGLSLGKLFLLVCGLCIFLKKRFSLSYPKKYIPFALYMFIVPFFYLLSTWTDVHSTIYKSIGLLVFVLILGFSGRLARLEYVTRYMRKSTLLFVAFFYLQFALNQFTGIRILGIIPGLPLADASTIDTYLTMQSKLSRYCSVFLEPSHFAVYISMYLALKLIFLERKVFDKETVFILFALVLLQSGNGYMCVLAIGISYVIVKWRQFLKPTHLIQLLFGVCVIGACLNFALNSVDFSDTFERMDELESDGDQNSSGFTRIFRGFYYYSDMNEFEKIFGIGQGNEFVYADTHPMSIFRSLATYTDNVYLNGVQQILVYGGILGLLLLIRFLLPYYKCRQTIMLVLPFTLLFFISGVYNSSTMLLYLVLLELVNRKFIKPIT